MMKYSFVIPTYNNKHNLLISLAALARLDYPAAAYEVIVVDDGSSDGLLAALDEFRAHFGLKTVRIERDARSCRSRARNHGWRAARGQVVVFIDSDIIVKPDYLLQLDRYCGGDCLVIGTRLHASDKVQAHSVADGSLFRSLRFAADDFSSLDYRYLVFSAQSFNGRAIPDAWLHAYSCNLALPRGWLAASGGFDENIIDWGLEDVELAYRLSALGVHVEINPYLETIHQAPGHRDDIAIGSARLSGYLDNIRYFLRRHPAALAHYPDPVGVLVQGHVYHEPAPGEQDLCISNYEEDCPEALVAALLRQGEGRHARIFLFDYASASGLDVHVQKAHSPSCPIHYFPMRRKVDIAAMTQYINTMRGRSAIPA